MSQSTEELQGLLKVASDQLRTAQEVIYELARQNQELSHQKEAQALALKLASTGQVPAAELPEKVAELEQKTDEDLELESKLASMTGPVHSLHNLGSPDVATGALDFLNT